MADNIILICLTVIPHLYTLYDKIIHKFYHTNGYRLTNMFVMYIITTTLFIKIKSNKQVTQWILSDSVLLYEMNH